MCRKEQEGRASPLAPGEQSAESREINGIPHLMPRRFPPQSPVKPLDNLCALTPPSVLIHPGLSDGRGHRPGFPQSPAWARSPPCSLLRLLRRGGAATRGVIGGAQAGGAPARGESKPLAGEGCGSHREPWPLRWAQPGPPRWAPSPRRWRGPAAPRCSWAGRRRSPRRHPLLAETLSRSPRPGGLDQGVERPPSGPQPGRHSGPRRARKGARS